MICPSNPKPSAEGLMWCYEKVISSTVHLKKRSLLMQIFFSDARSKQQQLPGFSVYYSQRKQREAAMQFSHRPTCKQWWQEQVFNNFEEEGREITRHGLVFHDLIFTTGITGRINKEGYENWQTIEWRVFVGASMSGCLFLIFSLS